MGFLHVLLAFLIVLGPLVAIHEFGHFWVARRVGVKVLTFSIGFGPALVKWQDRQGTRYQVAVVPLGGFVRMADEREGEVAAADLPRAFNRQPVWARMAIVAAGPLINLVFAVFLYWVLFLQPAQVLRPYVGRVLPHTPAAMAGVATGDEIQAVDGKPVADWEAVNYRLLDRMGESGELRLRLRPHDGTASRDVSLRIDHFLGGRQVDAFRELGMLPYEPPLSPVIDAVTPGGPAEAQGLKAGDRILSLDGEPVNSWQDIVDVVSARPEQVLPARVQRGNAVLSLQLVPASEKDNQGLVHGRLGIEKKELAQSYPAGYWRDEHHGPVEALGLAFAKTGKLIVFTLDSMGKMLRGLISVNNLSGPITIAKVAGQSAALGWQALLEFMALLSVSLGVLNLLPIPVLDGGHLVYHAIEGVIGRPLSERMQMLGLRIGVAMLMSLMLLAIFNDLSRL
jgi:regulator of sigma E protease